MHVDFEIAALFPSPYSREKKRANFKTNIHLDSVETFIYYLSSRLLQFVINHNVRIRQSQQNLTLKRLKNYLFMLRSSAKTSQLSFRDSPPPYDGSSTRFRTVFLYNIDKQYITIFIACKSTDFLSTDIHLEETKQISRLLEHNSFKNVSN